MAKKTYIIVMGILSLLFAAYLLSTVLKLELWANLISPVIAFIGCAVYFRDFIITGKKQYQHLTLGLMFLFWTIADLVWAYEWIILQNDPGTLVYLSYIYALPNLFLACTMGILLLQKRKSLNMAQFFLDTTANLLTGFLLIWILFFHSDLNGFKNIQGGTVAELLSIIVDLFICSSCLTWLSQKPKNKNQSATRIFISGVLLFALVDVYYEYLYFKNLYVPNTLVDDLYMAALILIIHGGMSGSVNSTRDVMAYNEETREKNFFGFSFQRIYLLCTPILLILLDKKLRVIPILLLLCIAVAHQIISNLIYNTGKHKAMLEQQSAMNEILEDCIAERTMELVKSNKELEQLSKQDSITCLYNRRYFMQTINGLLQEDTQDKIVFFFMDIDRFKAINDGYGHDTGDAVLCEIGERLNGWSEKGAIVARLGGDEFVMALQGDYGMKEAEELADEIIRRCNEPVIVGQYQFYLTMSMGITYYPADAKDVQTLMKNADIAMYQAKEQGCNQYMHYSFLHNEKLFRRIEIEMLLKSADYSKEFELFYQPKFSLPDEKLIGAEALLRWRHPQKGMIMPSEFIPIAEETGMIIPLGEWVLANAMRQIAKWNNQYKTDYKIGVNISFKQLDSVFFIETLEEMINTYYILPEWLDVEITESIAMKENYKIVDIFKKITGTGLSISIDDFGTGYSSLSYLKQYPINVIKIAKPLIDFIATDHRDANIVKAIILIAKALNVKVIAEGVETKEQLEILKQYKCDEIQGFLSGIPVSAAKFEQIYLAK